MRFIVTAFACFALLGCEKESETDCPKIWEFDRQQISANAFIDSSELVLEVWNPESPNAISLSQSYLEGDFEVTVSLNEMHSDTLLNPQFRMEVVSGLEPNVNVSGVAVHSNAFYCYVGGAYPGNGDMRLMNNAEGKLLISREADTLTCTGELGGVNMQFSDILASEKAILRFIFGSTTTGSGSVSVRLDELEVSTTGNENTPSVKGDAFDCRSW